MIHNFIRTLIPALHHAHQYTTSHPHTVSSIREAYTHLLGAIDEDNDLSLMIIGDRIVINEKPLEDSIHTSRFVRHLKARGIQHLTVEYGITFEEMTAFVGMISEKPGSWPSTSPFLHIRYGTVGVEEIVDNGDGDGTSANSNFFHDLQEEEFDLLTDIYDAARKGRKLPEIEISRIVGNIITAIQQESAVLLAFSPLRILDEYSFTHSTNVCILNIAQAMALGVEDEALHDIGVAALLHDTGKIFVPREILTKPGTLTDAEWERVRQHPRKGAHYLLDNPAIPPLAAIVAYEHHMGYDGTGYPKASQDWRQNLASQMTAVSDVFDAMRTKRVYRDSFEIKAIADYMTSIAGNALNPFLTKNFLFLMKKMHEQSNPEIG